MEKIRVVELFAGIGAQVQALKNLNANVEVVGISEWSINSLLAYSNLHHPSNEICDLSKEEILNELKDYTFSSNTKTAINKSSLNLEKLKKLYIANKNSKNLGSILDLKGENIPEHDLLTYSFPCTDLSNQGKQAGLYDGEASSLLWEVGRLLNELNSDEKLPKYLLMENVPAIFSPKHEKGFEKWKDNLKSLGYKNYAFKLKASYFGVPQNRERAYMVSILGDGDFTIPSQTELTNLTINDILDKTTNPKCYLNLVKYLPENINPRKSETTNIKCFDLVNYTSFNSENKVYSLDSVAPTLTATGAQSRIKVWDGKGITILNPRECWKLMGFKASEFDKVDGLMTNTALTKLAGNSIVVNVLEAIFKNLFNL